MQWPVRDYSGMALLNAAWPQCLAEITEEKKQWTLHSSISHAFKVSSTKWTTLPSSSGSLRWDSGQLHSRDQNLSYAVDFWVENPSVIFLSQTEGLAGCGLALKGLFHLFKCKPPGLSLKTAGMASKIFIVLRDDSTMQARLGAQPSSCLSPKCWDNQWKNNTGSHHWCK